MLQREHSAIISTFIKLPFVIKIFILSIFECPFNTGWWGRESWLLCLVRLPGVSWWLCGSSSRCHGFICGLWLWYILIILTVLTVFSVENKLWSASSSSCFRLVYGYGISCSNPLVFYLFLVVVFLFHNARFSIGMYIIVKLYFNRHFLPYFL